MVSDGDQFTSRFWKSFRHLIWVSIRLSNGQTERVNQETENTFRCLVSNDQTAWSKMEHLI